MSNPNSQTIFITGALMGSEERRLSSLLRADGMSSRRCETLRRKQSSRRSRESCWCRLDTPIGIRSRQQRHEPSTQAESIRLQQRRYGMSGPLEGLTDEQMLRMVNTNLLGAIRTTNVHSAFQRKGKRTVHQHDLDRWIDYRPFNSCTTLRSGRSRVGARAGVRVEPNRHWLRR